MELIKTKARMFALIVTVLAALMGAGLAGSAGITGPPPVSADEMDRTASKYDLECPTLKVQEGDSFEVYLVREPGEGQQDVDFGAWWHTQSWSADENDYVPLPGMSEPIQWTTDAERADNRQARTIQTIDDDEMEGDHSFWVRFTPSEGEPDKYDPNRIMSCMFVIEDDDPHVTGIEMVSSPARGQTYGLGEVIEFAAIFNNPVEVQGDVWMGLFVRKQWYGARYLRGSGTDTLVFSHTVRPEDRDENGVRVHNGFIDGDGQQIGLGSSDGSYIYGAPELPGSPVFPVHPRYIGIPNQWGHKVDGSQAPSVTEVQMSSKPASGDTYLVGEKIVLDVTFSAPVRTLNHPSASLWFDGTGESVWRGAKYVSGSGTNTLRFVYEVKLGDLDTDGLLVGAIDTEGLGDGKIMALDHDVAAIHTYGARRPGYKVDGQPSVAPQVETPEEPSVANVAITSNPVRSTGIYGQGEYVEFAVSFTQEVEVDGDVKLRLGIDYTEAAPNYATYASGSGTNSLFFRYEVAPMDYDNDGISIVPSDDGLFWGDGTVRADGTDADLDTTYAEIENFVGPEVSGGSPYHDTTSPRIRSVSIVSDAGDDDTYAAGDQITVAVTFNEYVSVYGDLQIGLDIGSEEKTATFLDRSVIEPDADRLGAEPQILLAYTVQEGDLDSDGISIGANKFSLNGGSIWDKSGNYADLTHEAMPADGHHMVDAVETGVLLSQTDLELEEGESATYTVALSSQPSADVTVNITRFPDAPLALPFLTMTFTPEDWNVPQEVTVVAESDDDDQNHELFLNHTAHGGGYHLQTAEIRVVIKDKDS